MAEYSRSQGHVFIALAQNWLCVRSREGDAVPEQIKVTPRLTPDATFALILLAQPHADSSCLVNCTAAFPLHPRPVIYDEQKNYYCVL